VKTIPKESFCLGLVLALMLALVFLVPFGITRSAKEELKPIVFGAPLPLGDPTGVEARQGAILAVEEINKQGGIPLPDGKHTVMLEIMDSRDLEPGVPVSEALLTTERLILEKKVDFIIGGPERTEAWLAATLLPLKHKVIMIAGPGCYSPAIEETIATDPDGKYKYCWKVNNDAKTDVMQVVPLFKKFKEAWGWSKFYVMVQDVAHTRAAGEAVSGLLGKRMGWEQLGFERYPTGTTDFSLGLLDAKKKGADLLYISMEMPQVSILMRQWAELKVPALPMGLMIAAQDVRFWEVSQGACEYALSNHFFVGNGPSKPINSSTERFFKDFTKRWNIEPGVCTGLPTYVAAWAVKDAIERARSKDPDKVVEALYKTDLQVPYGRLRFDPKGHDAIVTDDPQTGMVTMWLQWQSAGVEVMGGHSKRVCVWPPVAANGELKLPPWRR
jgi:branched-chain amino acid transport system substrate-binding protein